MSGLPPSQSLTADRFPDRHIPTKKTIYAKIEYLLPPEIGTSAGSRSEGVFWNQIRTCDALLHVVRNFEGSVGTPPTPEQDFRKLEDEMILSDLVVAEKRVERIELEKKRGKKPSDEESSLINSCCQFLEEGKPLRNVPELASQPLLKGFTFLSAKPMLILCNNDDEDEELPRVGSETGRNKSGCGAWQAGMDIASMTPEEAEEFLDAYHIQESALDRVIKLSYEILNRISFFTEVRTR